MHACIGGLSADKATAGQDTSFNSQVECLLEACPKALQHSRRALDHSGKLHPYAALSKTDFDSAPVHHLQLDVEQIWGKSSKPRIRKRPYDR